MAELNLKQIIDRLNAEFTGESRKLFFWYNDSGTKKVLLPMSSAAGRGSVPPEFVGSFNLIFYSSAESTVFKALGGESDLAGTLPHRKFIKCMEKHRHQA